MHPVAFVLVGAAVLMVAIGARLDQRAWRYFVGKREEREERKRLIQQDKRVEERIVAVGDEVEEWLAREHPHTVGDAVRHGQMNYAPFGQEVKPAWEPNSYYRLRCPGCGNTKDGWTDENGNFEDARDGECRMDDALSCFGKPMEEDDS